MRKISVVFFGLLFTGCSGLGEYAADTFWPMGSAEGPVGSGENFRRVHDGSNLNPSPELVMQPGNIWPGRVEPVPSIQEVSNSDSHFNRSFRHTLQTLDTDLETVQLKEHESLSIGEEANTEVGVHRKSRAVVPGSLPSEVPDPSSHYIEGANRDTIYIPNGDGTTTLVMPNGDVRIVRGNPQAVAKAQKERKIASDNIIIPPHHIAPEHSQYSQQSEPVDSLKSVPKIEKKTTEELNEAELAKAQREDGIVDHTEKHEETSQKQIKKNHLRKHYHNKKHRKRRHHAHKATSSYK